MVVKTIVVRDTTDLKSVGWGNPPYAFESRFLYNVTPCNSRSYTFKISFRDLIYKKCSMFKCECGREFPTSNSRNSHYRFCKIHTPQKKYDENGKYISKSKYKIDENLYRCECGKEFEKFQSLNAHFSHCDHHHKCCGTIRKGKYTEIHKTNC